MIDPKSRLAGPLLGRVSKEIFCFLIDIAEVAAVHAGAPQDDLRRIHQFPVSLLTLLQFEGLREKRRSTSDVMIARKRIMNVTRPILDDAQSRRSSTEWVRSGREPGRT